MKMDDVTIEKHLRQTPPPEPPAELYARLEADLPITDSSLDRISTLTPKVWIRRLATISLTLMALIASGAGVYLLTHRQFTRLEQIDLIPQDRMRDITEPVIPYEEDLQPIPLVLHDNILSMMQQAEHHQAITSQKTRWTMFDIQADGTTFWWSETSLDWIAVNRYEYQTSIHPNDFVGRWNYNLDGSPVIIKDVRPIHGAEGYIVQIEKPKDEHNTTIEKRLCFKRSFAKPFGSQWKIDLNRVQFGDARHLFWAIKLPVGAKLVKSSRPFTDESLGLDERQTLWFNDNLETHGEVLPVTVIYSKDSNLKE